jgi:hypothetical protein
MDSIFLAPLYQYPPLPFLNYEEIFSQESEECLDLSIVKAQHVCIDFVGSDNTPSSLPICRRAWGSELPAIWGTWLVGIRYGQWF